MTASYDKLSTGPAGRPGFGRRMEDMATSRLGASLRSARERMGWTREALAYHSGLSWAAIAQIESGRRQEVRVSSLVALASALGVSVDYLVGGAGTMSPQLLRHRVLIYASDEEYVTSVVPFLQEGIARSDAVVAVPSTRQGDLLHDALGDDAQHVEFLDSAEWYRTLRGAALGYRTFVKDRFDRGASWVRVIGDAVWAGRSTAEVTEWFRYESIINLALASSPTTIMCSYDGRSLPQGVLADARRTHRELAEAGEVTANPSYLEPEDFLLGLG
jgi:transcriptional regulator with XRE-family HTH domain